MQDYKNQQQLFVKTLTAKWSWYRRNNSSILDFLEQQVGERTCNIVFKVPVQVQLQKVKDGRLLDIAATVSRPFCKVFKNGCTILVAGCTTTNQYGTPNALRKIPSDSQVGRWFHEVTNQKYHASPQHMICFTH